MNQQQFNPDMTGMPPVGGINPLEYPAVKCPECGGQIFVPGLLLRKIPGSLVGQAGMDMTAPVKVFYCVNCRSLSPQDQEMIDEAELAAAENQKPKSNIIV